MSWMAGMIPLLKFRVKGVIPTAVDTWVSKGSWLSFGYIPVIEEVEELCWGILVGLAYFKAVLIIEGGKSEV